MAPISVTWKSLPDDVRILILSHLSLPDAFNVNIAHPHPAHSSTIRQRIKALQTLRNAWVESQPNPLPSRDNPPHLSTRSERASLPPALFTQIKVLTLRQTKLASLGPIHEFPNLRIIDAAHNMLSTLPSSIVTCKTLRVLDLGFNRFQHFPSSVMHLPRLCTLLLYNNPLSSLPSENWSAFSHLRLLGFGNCQLTALPNQFCEWLTTQTQHGRFRSADFEGNNIDPEAIAKLFRTFPRLSAAILI